jgi:hypothetical protein
LRLRNRCCKRKTNGEKKFSAGAANAILFPLPHALILTFRRGFGKPGVGFRQQGKSALQLVPQSLLMPMRFHAFAAFVLGNFCFSSFLKRAHSDT